MIRPTSTLAPYKFTSKKGEVFTTWAPLPNPKIKTSLSQVQALKFILQVAASKVGNCVFPNSNLQILSSKSNLRSSFANLFNFKFSKTCWKSPKLNKGILAHFEKMSLARWFWAFFFFLRVFCLVKWGDFFLGGANEGLFPLWSISSYVGVQIVRELVRLMILIGLNKFRTNVTPPMSLKKFSRTTFRWSVVKKRSFLMCSRLS